MITLAVGLASLVVWIDLIFARGQFWRVAERLDPVNPHEPRAFWPSVAAVMPARNEAALIGETAPACLGQDYPGPLTLVVVDDQSSDPTASLARRVSHADRQALVVEGVSPPHGWTGKLWAMQQGVDRADQAARPDYLLFVDADIRLQPDVLRRLVALAETRGTVLVSLMAKLRCASAAERWLVPAFIFFFRMLYPFAWVNDPSRWTAAAAGGCMLVDRQALTEAGGLTALRGALIDDCALAAALKRHGPIWLGMSDEALSLRAYPRFADFGRMIMRSAFAQLRYSVLWLALTIVAMAVVFVAPPLLALFANGLAEVCGAIAWAMMAFAFAPTLGFYGESAARAVGLPAIAGLYTLFTVGSAGQVWRGRGGEWKGRIQAPALKGRRA